MQQSFDKSLLNLGTTYIDSLLLHSPMDTHQKTMVVWREFERFHKQGRVRQLGVSNNYELRSFQALFRDAEVKPTVLQNRQAPPSARAGGPLSVAGRHVQVVLGNRLGHRMRRPGAR